MQIDHFCDFVPISTGLQPVQCFPFWFGQTHKVVILMYHDIGCSLCQECSAQRILTLKVAGGVQARGE